tara:strand:+ start:912 stop:2057 length:1146 start_codon:yes stop_codon:yes gene_type:complete
MDLLRDHLGFYEVNGKKFRSKLQALQTCKNKEWPTWNFNEAVFSEFNWKKEPPQPLYELYKKRAMQIREKYDRVILFYSGGIDSTAMLRSFVDNDIKIDAVVSYGCFSLYDNKSLLRNLEIYRSAIPYIKQLQKTYKYKLNYYLLDDWAQFLKFKDESWTTVSGTSSLRPEGYAFNFFHENNFIKNIMNQGKTVLLRGIDKPRILYDVNTKKWSLSFLDCAITGLDSHGLSEKTNSWYALEYFYWAPDLPELLCKQAHIIKKNFENYSLEFKQRMFGKGNFDFDTQEYYNYIDPLIYSRYTTQTIGQKRNYFTLGKGGSTNITLKDTEFFRYADTKIKNVWFSGMKYVADSVDHMYFNQSGLKGFMKKGFIGIWTKSYEIN